MDSHHGHNQLQQHGKAQASSYVEANKELFSTQIALFEKPQVIELAKRAADAFKKQYSFDEETTVVLDFACGTGLISRELAPSCKTIVGVDITQALVDNFNERVFNQGIAPEEMRAVCVELKGQEGELDGLKFDVVVCAASYHHFESVEEITRTLAFFLKPGGALLIVDVLDPEEAASGTGSNSSGTVFPEHFNHVVAHMKGFKSQALRTVFESAGLTFSIKPISKATLHGNEVTLFVAKGEKPNVV